MKKYVCVIFVIISLILSGCGQIAKETSNAPVASTPSNHVMLTASLPACVIANSKVSIVDSDNNLITQASIKEENGNKKIEVEIPNDKDIKLLDNQGQTLKEIVKSDLLNDLLVNLISWNKGVVSGTVTLPSGSNANILVKLLGTQFNAYTDEYGSYKIMYIPEGTYVLSIEKTSYVTVTQNITIEPLKNTTSNSTVMEIANCTVVLTPTSNEWIDSGLNVVAYTQYPFFNIDHAGFDAINNGIFIPNMITWGYGASNVIGAYEVLYKVGVNGTVKRMYELLTTGKTSIMPLEAGRLYFRVVAPSEISDPAYLPNNTTDIGGSIDIHILH